MHRLYGIAILLLLYFPVLAQVIFDRIPRDLQLYPRDAMNQATVTISGNVTETGYSRIGMQLLREGVLTRIVTQTLTAGTATSAFSLTATIKAEPAEYSFRAFLYKGLDSTLVAERSRILCGDVYIIHGQSNALALADLPELYSFNFDDKYMRTVAVPAGGSAADVAWFPAKLPFGSVGGLGLTLQRLILQTYKIPTCVINGAVSGATIDTLSDRTPGNHANPATYYGNLLYRAQWADVARQAKAIIWKQGEAESGAESPNYARKFTTLYNQFREDFGDMRLYVGQINILTVPQDSAAALRDFQRRTKYLYKNVETIATVGTPGYDGVHYSGVANQQIAAEQFRQIARDLYGSTDTLQINSPGIKKVFYNARKDSITLVFDEQMQMVWTRDTTFISYATGAVQSHLEQKDFFYLDKQPGWVTGGSANGNRIVLSLKQSASAKALRYLPAYFSTGDLSFYDGPTLRNTRGMRAFSFDGVPIADALATITTLAAKPLTDKQIQLSWTATPADQYQIVERADGTPTNFQRVALLNGTTASYTDANLPDPTGTYYYRIRLYNNVSESTSSNVASARPLILGLETPEPLVQFYPNPVTTDRLLRVSADQLTFTSLSLHDLLGRTVKNWRGTAKNTLSIALQDLEAGLYIAELQTIDGHMLRRKVVVR